MIASDFIYCRPDTVEEAVAAYTQLDQAGKTPVYYGGGSEIITMTRAGSIKPGAVIDLKAIPECKILERTQMDLTIGGAVTLHCIRESKLFGLLSTAVGRIADHTNQCRITLGGNLCGTIRYREAALPLLLADAQVALCGPEGRREVPIHAVFHERMQLKPGELVCRIKISSQYPGAVFMHVKKTTNEKIDYPLVNVSAIIVDGRLRAAFSGLCAFPFRSEEIEAALNDHASTIEGRLSRAASLLPAPAVTDVEGSGEYRIFVWKNTLRKVLEMAKHDLA